jgi:hypothetical protein
MARHPQPGVAPLARHAVAGVSARRGYRVVGAPTSARGVSIPAPVEGLDAITPLASMPPTRAVTLDNIFPQPGYVEIRKGHRRHNLTGAAAIESLMPYHGLASDDDRLFSASSTAISNVTVFTSATASSTASISLSGLTNARWQHVNYSTSGGNHLWICNGADAPRMYNGTAWATASVVGITAADVINVAVFKNRLWLTLKDEISPAYLNTDSVQGTATPFDLTGVFDKGGFLQAIGSWSLDAGTGPDDYIAFITNRGEVAIYTGTDPATNFVLKGVYEMGAPIGRRCLTKVGADLAVISVDGVLPLSRALITDRAAALTQSITKLIQPLMNQAARLYGTNFGWQLLSYPRGTRAILNVPITEGVEQIQYVMNTITGAWGRFKREDANCWAVFQDRLFYGGNDGIVREADCQGYDDDGAIEFDIESAYNYMGERGRLKNFTMARALLTTDGQVLPGLGLNVDFARQQAVGATSFETDAAALWDVASWDEGTWPEVQRIVTDWISVAGIGYCAGVRMTATVSPGVDVDESQELVLQINGWDVLVLDGAFL